MFELPSDGAEIPIGGKPYHVLAYPCPDGLRSYSVNSPDGTKDYDVAELADGRVSCTCMDWQCRRNELPGLSYCKHGRALADLGLVEGRCPRAAVEAK